jgi:hypothetical protein
MHNLRDLSLGKVIASSFFGVGLTGIVFTNAELFTSNNMYLTVSSAEGRTSWRQTALLRMACYLGNLVGLVFTALLLYSAGSFGELPADHALFTGALHKAHQAGTVIFFKGILAKLDRMSSRVPCAALQGRGCQDHDLNSGHIHFRISRVRTLDRQHGDLFDGDTRWRRLDPRRCDAQPATIAPWAMWREVCCW